MQHRKMEMDGNLLTMSEEQFSQIKEWLKGRAFEGLNENSAVELSVAEAKGKLKQTATQCLPDLAKDTYALVEKHIIEEFKAFKQNIKDKLKEAKQKEKEKIKRENEEKREMAKLAKARERELAKQEKEKQRSSLPSDNPVTPAGSPSLLIKPKAAPIQTDAQLKDFLSMYTATTGGAVPAPKPLRKPKAQKQHEEPASPALALSNSSIRSAGSESSNPIISSSLQITLGPETLQLLSTIFSLAASAMANQPL